jgi:predicted O-linked N-acetylglucosamine transferase (SPINDLY family)
VQNNLDRLLERGKALVELNLLAEATDLCRQALAMEPNNPECLLWLSYVLMRMKYHAESLHFARHFLRIVDDVAYGYFLAGYTARETGRWSESRSYLLRAVELDPTHIYARVLCCMTVFTVCMDETEAESILNTYTVELDQLISETPLETAGQIDNAVDGLGAYAPFFLPYLGCDVTGLQAKYGAWVCSVMALKYPEFTHPLPPRSSNGKIRIGVISNYFHYHSHWKIAIKGWIEQIDRNLFSIHCFHTGDIRDDITEYARSISDTFLHSSDIDKVIVAISDQELNVLIHSGIGMDTNTLKLAGLRLAPVQCSSLGHPLTTGMPTVDYFISGELTEPLDGDLHYTEKLIRLPNLPIYCEPVEPLEVSTAEFVIPGVLKDDVTFLCCQNLMKYLPRYDHVFPDIARRAGNARFVFIGCHIAEITKRFTQRLEQAFQRQGLTMSDYVVFVPSLSSADYAALNANVDIFLDSIGWSGGNTTLESLPYNKPIVTFSGQFMRGMVTCGMLRMMGMEDLIAETADEYVSIAVKLADDLQWRQDISDRICRNKHKIYHDTDCIEGLEQFLLDVSGRKSTVLDC